MGATLQLLKLLTTSGKKPSLSKKTEHPEKLTPAQSAILNPMRLYLPRQARELESLEDQIRASAKGLFSLAALSVDCNVWFLSDDEANTFVPSLTLGLNQAFPSVAASKWGALSLAALSITAIVTAKTLAYLSYKADVRRRAAQPTDAPPTSAT